MAKGSSDCPNATVQCLCSSHSFQADVAHCIKTNCFTDTDQMNAYKFAYQVCAQVGVTLPSFNDLGKNSGGAVVRVGYGVSLSVIVGMMFFVGGLL